LSGLTKFFKVRKYAKVALITLRKYACVNNLIKSDYRMTAFIIDPVTAAINLIATLIKLLDYTITHMGRTMICY